MLIVKIMETKDENAVTEAATALLTIAMTPVEISSLDNVRSDNIDNTNTKKRGAIQYFIGLIAVTLRLQAVALLQ